MASCIFMGQKMRANRGGRSGEGSSRARGTGKRKRGKTVGESSQSESVSESEEELPPGLSEAQDRKEKAKNDMEKWKQIVLTKSVTYPTEFQKGKKFVLGKFKPEYKLMTKIIHYNIAPTWSEKELKLADAEFLYVMMNSVIIDVAECILNEMIFFKEKAPSRANMPFVAMISSICLATGAPLINDPLIQPPIGPITMTSIKKSSAMSRPPKVSQSASVNVPPSSEIPPDIPSSSIAPPPKKKKSWKARIEGYIKKLLCRQFDFEQVALVELQAVTCGLVYETPVWANFPGSPIPYSPLILPGFDEEEFMNRLNEDEGALKPVPNPTVALGIKAAGPTKKVNRTATKRLSKGPPRRVDLASWKMQTTSPLFEC
ncbi:hypothetical protein Acr_11g0011160 [Actinidia rufa]|uniref:Putative plant transposon protein domain-containing protein n=1 Tax=Actinidia rufa TaxID=165716 RepID=A0A7J0FDN1_9ERIC|nr:hypothetical protein Acr_11g0011160 [Actinidia rufa]